MKTLFIVLLLFSSTAWSQVIVSLGTGVAWEHETDGTNMEGKKPSAIRAGYSGFAWDFISEFSRFTQQQGTTILQVKREHYEALVWGRYRLLPERKITPFGALAMGLNFDDVRTDFNAQSTKQRGRPEFTGAMAAGVAARIWHIETSLEGRLTTAASYSPNPLIGVHLFAGVFF